MGREGQKMEIKAKSYAKLRQLDNEKEQQKSRKGQSRKKLRKIDNVRVKEQLRNWREKSDAKLKARNSQKFKADQNARNKLIRNRRMAMDPKGVTIAERKAQYKKKIN